MNNEPILDSQNEIWGHLSQIVLSNKIGSAYLFSGPAGSGKEAISISSYESKKWENDTSPRLTE